MYVVIEEEEVVVDDSPTDAEVVVEAEAVEEEVETVDEQNFKKNDPGFRRDCVARDESVG